MKTYSEKYVQIRRQLLEACDDRLLKLDADGWDDRVVPVAEVPEELGETALWLVNHGFRSVEQMIDNMIWTLQEEIGADLVIADDVEALKIRCVKNADGYYVPIIDVIADIVRPGEYWVGEDRLTDEYSAKCWNTLPESARTRLESLDWDDLSYEDNDDIVTMGRYNVEIEINSDGEISFTPCD